MQMITPKFDIFTAHPHTPSETGQLWQMSNAKQKFSYFVQFVQALQINLIIIVTWTAVLFYFCSVLTNNGSISGEGACFAQFQSVFPYYIFYHCKQFITATGIKSIILYLPDLGPGVVVNIVYSRIRTRWLSPLSVQSRVMDVRPRPRRRVCLVSSSLLC